MEQSASVIRRLVKLLVSSFHPTGKGTDIQVNLIPQALPIAMCAFVEFQAHPPSSRTSPFQKLREKCSDRNGLIGTVVYNTVGDRSFLKGGGGGESGWI